MRHKQPWHSGIKFVVAKFWLTVVDFWKVPPWNASIWFDDDDGSLLFVFEFGLGGSGNDNDGCGWIDGDGDGEDDNDGDEFIVLWVRVCILMFFLGGKEGTRGFIKRAYDLY